MMRDLLYASYDEGAYCTPVMMRGRIVRQLCVGRNRETNKLLMMTFMEVFREKQLAKYSRHAT